MLSQKTVGTCTENDAQHKMPLGEQHPKWTVLYRENCPEALALVPVIAVSFRRALGMYVMFLQAIQQIAAKTSGCCIVGPFAPKGNGITVYDRTNVDAYRASRRRAVNQVIV